MTKVSVHNISYPDAKAIINAFYEFDRSSSFVGKQHHYLTGGVISVSINPVKGGFTVDVSSGYYTESSINQVIKSVL